MMFVAMLDFQREKVIEYCLLTLNSEDILDKFHSCCNLKLILS